VCFTHEELLVVKEEWATAHTRKAGVLAKEIASLTEDAEKLKGLQAWAADKLSGARSRSSETELEPSHTEEQWKQQQEEDEKAQRQRAEDEYDAAERTRLREKEEKAQRQRTEEEEAERTRLRQKKENAQRQRAEDAYEEAERIRLREKASEEAEQAIHVGVRCDVSGMHPIVGPRFNKKGLDFDLCEAEYIKLGEAEKGNYIRIDHPKAQRQAGNQEKEAQLWEARECEAEKHAARAEQVAAEEYERDNLLLNCEAFWEGDTKLHDEMRRMISEQGEFAVFVEHDFIHPGPLGLRLRQDVGTFMGHKEHVVRVVEVNNPELKGKIRPDMLLYAVNKATLVGLTIEEAMYQIGEEKKRCLSSGETMTVKFMTDDEQVRT
jgi:hypothetical protein